MRAMSRFRLAALALLTALCGCSTGSSDRTAATQTAPPGPATAAAATTPKARAAAAIPGPEAQAAALKRFARIGKPIYCGAGKRRLVALTFDDGPGPYTPIVLRQLREAGAHATF